MASSLVPLLFAAVPTARAYTPHAPIMIIGDANFTASNGVVRGSGTPGDPFVIEGWEISGSLAHGVWINNTSAHFVIRDVYVHSNDWEGIAFDEVRNGRVEDSVVEEGISLGWYSRDVEVRRNNVTGGVGGAFGTRATIADNVIVGGISFIYSDNATISGNRISGSGGISLRYVTDIAVTSNILMDGPGLELLAVTDITVRGNTFTSTGIWVWGPRPDHFTSLAIEPDNTVNGWPIHFIKDCGSATIDGISVGQVIVAGCSNARIANLRIADTKVGIQVAFSGQVAITNVSVSGSAVGVSLLEVVDAVVESSEIAANTDWIGYGVWVARSSNVSVQGNRIDGNGGAGVSVYGASSIRVARNTISSNVNGIYVSSGGGFYDVSYGPTLDIQIEDNTIESSAGWGVYADAIALQVQGNVVAFNRDGLQLSGPTSIVVSDNLVAANTDKGVQIGGWNVTTAAVVVTRNSFSANALGLHLVNASTLAVDHNNFLNNAVQALSDLSGDVWDAGCPAGGNYWSDYVGTDALDCTTGGPGTDGLGDVPYAVDGDSRDRFPRILPVILNTAPVVSLRAPAGGEAWTGGSEHAIRWDAADAENETLRHEIRLDLNGGGDGFPILVAAGESNATAGNEIVWTVPFLDSTEAHVRVCVQDLGGLTTCAQNAVALTIDSRPPRLVSAVPADGATGVPTDGDLVLTFSEPMNRATVESSIVLLPTGGELRFRWNAMETEVRIAAGALAPGTDYALTIGAEVRDASDPGNPLGTPQTIRFRSAAVPPLPEGSEPSLWWLLVAAILLSAPLWSTETGRIALLGTLLAPVARRRYEGEEDPETRGMILGYLRVHPGDTYTDIKRNLGLSNGSFLWHLGKLEKAGKVRSRNQGPHRRYYPAESTPPLEDGGELHDIQRRILEAVQREPGIPVTVLAEGVTVSSQLALYHLRKLSRKGLIVLERRGFRLTAFPTPENLRTPRPVRS